MNDIILYFNEELHKYTDVYGNTYTSVTTLIGNYKDKFDKWNVAKACERIGKNPTHPDYGKYRGKSAKRIIKEWDIINKEACEFGTEKHNYLEDSIKSANGYNRISNKYVNDRIYTVPEIIKNPNHGVLNLDYFKLKGIEKHYPIIYNFLSLLTNKGFRIYAEVGVFDVINLVSGLIDVFCYNPDKGTFLILDWKTNNAPIKFEAGYFKKDIAGNRLDTFINKEEYFKYPISHLQASKGNEYSLQLSLYSYLASKFKINHKGNVLFHIRHDVDENGLNIIDIPKLPDLTNESKLLLEHNLIKVKKNTVNKQGTLFNNLKKITV